jgi:NAD(P)H-hydrate repair Nnr-like enzyme with NAD(P)H-hydrate dehydratase domain
MTLRDSFGRWLAELPPASQPGRVWSSSYVRARQTAEIALDDAATVAAALAHRYSAVVAYQRQVADPHDGRWNIAAGNAGLGTSGSGDVLAGAITGLLARELLPELPAILTELEIS